MTESPVVTSKIIGYRWWNLDGYRLLSSNFRLKGYWHVGVNQAECRYHLYHASMYTDQSPIDPLTHSAPDPGCECGLYAYHDIDQLNGYTFNRSHGVYGAVLAWGNVETHAAGFRAQYAEPIAFAYASNHRYEEFERAQLVAQEFELPFVSLGDLKQTVHGRGISVPVGLRPEPPPIVDEPVTPPPTPTPPPRAWFWVSLAFLLVGLALYVTSIFVTATDHGVWPWVDNISAAQLVWAGGLSLCAGKPRIWVYGLYKGLEGLRSLARVLY